MHHQVYVGVGRDLRQVRDHDDLVGAGQPREPSSDLHGRPATDPGVDLVEHHGRARRRSSEHDFQRQHHPGQFAARRALGQRQLRHPPVRRETELDFIYAIGAGPSELARGQLKGGRVIRGCDIQIHIDGELGVGHREPGQLGGDLLGQPLGGRAPDLAEVCCC